MKKPVLGFVSIENDNYEAMRLAAKMLFKQRRSLLTVVVSGKILTRKFERTSETMR
jgi:hypothetical protein